MLRDVLTAGSLPALDAGIRFAAQRQALIAGNIANFETPGYIQRDVRPAEFQDLLSSAVEARRRRTGGAHGELELRSTRHIRARGETLHLTPREPLGGILYHDRTNRDIERTLQQLAENGIAFRVLTELHRGRMTQLHSAIAERVG